MKKTTMTVGLLTIATLCLSMTSADAQIRRRAVAPVPSSADEASTTSQSNDNSTLTDAQRKERMLAALKALHSGGHESKASAQAKMRAVKLDGLPSDFRDAYSKAVTAYGKVNTGRNPMSNLELLDEYNRAEDTVFIIAKKVYGIDGDKELGIDTNHIRGFGEEIKLRDTTPKQQTEAPKRETQSNEDSKQAISSVLSKLMVANHVSQRVFVSAGKDGQLRIFERTLAELKKIDTGKCPKDFADAFKSYCAAYESMHQARTAFAASGSSAARQKMGSAVANTQSKTKAMFAMAYKYGIDKAHWHDPLIENTNLIIDLN